MAERPPSHVDAWRKRTTPRVRNALESASRYYKNARHAELWLKRRSREEEEALIREYAMRRTASVKGGPHDFVPVGPKSRPGPIHKFGGGV